MANVHDYFSFSKRERIGVIVLVILIIIVFILPEFFPSATRPVDSTAAAEINKQIASLKLNTKDSGETSHVSMKENVPLYYEPSREHSENTLLFEFDPNTISEDGWKKLGIRDRTIRTIQRYIAKGGQFRRPEDLAKIYGIRKDEFERLLPYVKIPGHSITKHPDNDALKRTPAFNQRPNSKFAVIELNAADTAMLIALPGIGSKLASRIINFRNKLGGFYSVDQVKETYGLPDSTFQTVRPFLQCDTSQIQQININTADLNVLKNHPYIKWNIANAIVNYRQQHGKYQSVEDLLKIEVISTDHLQALIPYLRAN